MKEQEIRQNKLLYRTRYKIAMMAMAVLLIGIFFCFPLMLKSMYPTMSEIIIRKAAAAQLNKDPNELTKKDFAKIEVLSFRNETELSDLEFLKKFVNLKELGLRSIQPSPFRIPVDTPRWKVLLSKLGIINIPTTYVPPWRFERRIIDMRPIEKLRKLEKLDLSGTSIRSVDSLALLKNLRELDLSLSGISDIEPIKKLKNLQKLNLSEHPDITIEQIQNLQNALPNLKISYGYTYTPPWLKSSSNENETEK